MNEKEYKEYIYAKANEVRTKEELDALLNEVVNDQDLDYGKIVYAMSGCMLAVSNYIDRSEVGGITGFQASFIGWEMVKKFLHESKIAMRIVDYEDMLYPQYKNRFEKRISHGIWFDLQERAKKLLEERKDAHPDVIKHWKKIASGKVPFGYKVRKWTRF